ncbi:sensor histidine kinase [Chitinophaga cymbidii]|uniref:histidine kinase n=1 Tax=Chitinophaga cymbidii TaxID=1096750 RepID=A0A512RPE3_9BACT|nr:PAS domain S-box protein [Chitinophaga cymbidii]GEP97568.1 hypothetical protein CCY01nite_38280 [Chitinophaga cymbidii]
MKSDLASNSSEKAIQQQEEISRQLLSSLPAAVYTTDAEGYITSFNKAAATLWGREPETGKDRWCGFLKTYRMDGSPLPPEASPMAIALKEKRPVHGEQIIIERPDGVRRHVRPFPTPVFDGEGRMIGAVNMLIDFTQTAEVHHRNEALIRSEEQYHKMIEEVEDYAILLMDREGIILNWNRGAEKIKGYREEEIVGKHFRTFYRPDDREKGLPELLIARAISEGKATHEGWRIRKDGTAFWGSIVITALHDRENNIIGFSKVTRDLTEKKNAEDRITQYANELEAQNRELQQFAYAAAHDMKEPLRKVLFYTSAILEKLQGQLPDREMNYLKLAAEASRRMQGLIDDLLVYTKSASSAAVFEEVDLAAVTEELKAFYQDTIDRTGAVIQGGPLPVIWAIPFQVRQLLENLFGNALKYCRHDRTPVIQISYGQVARDAVRELAASEYDLFHRITVKDNGIGFEPGYAEKIFEMFERLHGRDNYPGTGIGLALCRKIVQNHKGWIKAEGHPGEGAEFFIYLPVINAG